MLTTSLWPGAVPERWDWQKQGQPNFGEFGVRLKGGSWGALKGGGLGFPKGTLLFWGQAHTREVRPVAGSEGALLCTASAGLKLGGAAQRGRDAGGRAGSVPYSPRDRQVRAERGLRGSGQARPEETRSLG